jgi:hypothetical protein
LKGEGEPLNAVIQGYIRHNLAAEQVTANSAELIEEFCKKAYLEFPPWCFVYASLTPLIPL